MYWRNSVVATLFGHVQVLQPVIAVTDGINGRGGLLEFTNFEASAYTEATTWSAMLRFTASVGPLSWMPSCPCTSIQKGKVDVQCRYRLLSNHVAPQDHDHRLSRCDRNCFFLCHLVSPVGFHRIFVVLNLAHTGKDATSVFAARSPRAGKWSIRVSPDTAPSSQQRGDKISCATRSLDLEDDCAAITPPPPAGRSTCGTTLQLSASYRSSTLFAGSYAAGPGM